MNERQRQAVQAIIDCVDEGEAVRPGGLLDTVRIAGVECNNALFVDVRLLKQLREAFKDE